MDWHPFQVLLGLTLGAALATWFGWTDSWTAIDGDTLDHNGARYRIQGLAAPERYEPGGPAATAALQAIVDRGDVACEPTGARTWDREEAVCTAAGEDLGALMIAGGWGRACVAYGGERYLALETAAGRELPLPDYCDLE